MLISASTRVVFDVSQKTANLFKMCTALDGFVPNADKIHSLQFHFGEDEKGERTNFVHFDGRITAQQDRHLYSRHMRQLVLGRGPLLFVAQYQPYSGELEIVRNDFGTDYLAKINMTINRCLDAPVNQHVFGKTRN